MSFITIKRASLMSADDIIDGKEMVVLDAPKGLKEMTLDDTPNKTTHSSILS